MVSYLQASEEFIVLATASSGTSAENGAATNTEVGAGDGHGAKDPFPPFDPSTYGSQLLWLAITFGLLYYLMSKIALPRIASILEDRRDRIANDLSEAERLRAETDEAIAAYETDLANARKEAQGIAQATRDKLSSDIEAKRTQVEVELAEKLASAETRIQDIKTKALGEVSGIATDTADAIVAELLGQSADKAAVESAVNTAMKH